MQPDETYGGIQLSDGSGCVDILPNLVQDYEKDAAASGGFSIV